MMDAVGAREAARFASKHVKIEAMQPLSCLETHLMAASTRFEFVEVMNRRPLGVSIDTPSHSHMLMGDSDQLDSNSY